MPRYDLTINTHERVVNRVVMETLVSAVVYSAGNTRKFVLSIKLNRSESSMPIGEKKNLIRTRLQEKLRTHLSRHPTESKLTPGTSDRFSINI